MPPSPLSLWSQSPAAVGAFSEAAPTTADGDAATTTTPDRCCPPQRERPRRQPPGKTGPGGPSRPRGTRYVRLRGAPPGGGPVPRRRRRRLTRVSSSEHRFGWKRVNGWIDGWIEEMPRLSCVRAFVDFDCSGSGWSSRSRNRMAFLCLWMCVSTTIL